MISALALLACVSDEVDTVPEVVDVGLTDATAIRTALDADAVPDRSSWLEPALFWSHDLPLSATCETDLCVRTGTALVSPLGASEPMVLVVVDLDPEPLDADVNVVFAVDTSGSMQSEEQALVRDALDAWVGELSSSDLAGLITFDLAARDSRSPRAMEAKHKSALIDAAERTAQGGTDVAEGLAAALSMAASSHGRGHLSHVLLLTDQPVSDDADPDAVVGLIRRHGVAGIGTTLVGLDAHLGAALAIERSVGGRTIALEADGIGTLAEHLPVARNVQLELAPADGWTVTDSWLLGDSTQDEPAWGQAWLGTAHPGGGRAVAFVLTPDERVTSLAPDTVLGALDLTWEGPIAGDARLSVVAGDTTAFRHTTIAADTLGAYRFAALLDEAIALDAADTWCAGEDVDAWGQAVQAADRLAAAAAALDEDGDSLAREAARMADLATRLDGGAPCF